MWESGSQGSNTFTLTDGGSNSYTLQESGNQVLGSYTITQTGADGYSMTETGSHGSKPYSETVSGSDTYTESGNADTGTFSRTTTLRGTYTRRDTGTGATKTSGSGSITYTGTESGDSLSGNLTLTATGNDRYNLLEQFNDASDSGANSPPGHLDFYAFGLPFVDPSPDGAADAADPGWTDAPTASGSPAPVAEELPGPGNDSGTIVPLADVVDQNRGGALKDNDTLKEAMKLLTPEDQAKLRMFSPMTIAVTGPSSDWRFMVLRFAMVFISFASPTLRCSYGRRD